MNINTETVVVEKHCCRRYISWTAIFAGALVAVGLTFLFNILTLGGSLSAYTHTKDGVETLAVAAFIWMLAGGFAMLYIAGLVAGRLIGKDRSWRWTNGVLHGFLAWCVYLMISFAFLSALAPNAFVSPLKMPTLEVMDPVNDKGVQKADQRADQRTIVRDDENKVQASEEDVNQAGVATLATFFLFLAGAIGASLGGWCGINLCREHVEREEIERTTTKVV